MTIEQMTQLEPRLQDLAYMAHGIACLGCHDGGLDLAAWHRDVAVPLGALLDPASSTSDPRLRTKDAYDDAQDALRSIAHGGSIPECLIGDALKARFRVCSLLNRGELSRDDWEYLEAEAQRRRVRKVVEELMDAGAVGA